MSGSNSYQWGHQDVLVNAGPKHHVTITSELVKEIRIQFQTDQSNTAVIHGLEKRLNKYNKNNDGTVMEGLCGDGGIVWRWRDCVKMEGLCGDGGIVWRWRDCVEMEGLCEDGGSV